jgi:hypothetical protein
MHCANFPRHLGRQITRCLIAHPNGADTIELAHWAQGEALPRYARRAPALSLVRHSMGWQALPGGSFGRCGRHQISRTTAACSDSQTDRVATCDHSHVCWLQEAFLLYPSVNFESNWDENIEALRLSRRTSVCAQWANSMGVDAVGGGRASSELADEEFSLDGPVY